MKINYRNWIKMLRILISFHQWRLRQATQSRQNIMHLIKIHPCTIQYLSGKCAHSLYAMHIYESCSSHVSVVLYLTLWCQWDVFSSGLPSWDCVVIPFLLNQNDNINCSINHIYGTMGKLARYLIVKWDLKIHKKK